MGTMKRSLSGFTLVEMSIVIVIIGLIAGGVVVGQSLIRASKVGSIIVDVNRTRQAVQIFREKYNALPGDMPNATTIWGEISPGCTNATSTDKTTCNGNGDGRIINSSAFAPTPTYAYEGLRAWQHLANAGLADGNFSGGSTVAGQLASGQVGINLPEVPFEEATMLMVGMAAGTAAPHILGVDGLDFIMYGRYTPNSTTAAAFPSRGFLSGSEAESIDLKNDDGRPGSGNVRGYKNTSGLNSGCTTTDDLNTSLYAITDTSKVCALVFVLSPER